MSAGTCSGNALQVDVCIITVYQAKVLCHFDHPFHGVIGIPENAGAQKQALDVIPPVEFNCQFHQLFDGKGGALNVIAPPVNAVGAVVYAVVGEHDLEQGNASSVFRKTVANSPCCGVADAFSVIGPLHTAGCAGHIVFGSASQYFKLLQGFLTHF